MTAQELRDRLAPVRDFKVLFADKEVQDTAIDLEKRTIKLLLEKVRKEE